MFHISSLLDKIKDRHLKGRLEIEGIAKAIQKISNAPEPIHFSKIKLIGTKLSITAHPILKNQIMLKKEVLMKEIELTVGKKITAIF